MLNISDERARTKMGILSVRFIEYLTVFIVAHSRCNYSAPIEVSPIGMSDHLTVLQQQELHCISNFRSS